MNNEENNKKIENRHDKHFEKKYRWEEATLNPEPEFETIPELLPEPTAPEYEFKLPAGLNKKNLPLIIGGIVLTILGFLGIYIVTKPEAKPKPKAKPKVTPTPKTITKTITKVRAPTNEELADYVKKNKKDKIIKEESEEQEEKDKK